MRRPPRGTRLPGDPWRRCLAFAGMRFDKLTIKSQEALSEAQSAGHDCARAQRDPARRTCCAPCSAQPEGSTSRCCRSSASPLDQLQGGELEKAPRGRSPRSRRRPATSSRAPPHRALEAAFAEAEADTLKDEYVSTEHLLLAIARREGRPGRSALRPGRRRARGASSRRWPSVRGRRAGHRPDPESKYQALEKFGRDLTDVARTGKARPRGGARRGDPARHAGALAPHQEQPGADR